MNGPLRFPIRSSSIALSAAVGGISTAVTLAWTLVDGRRALISYLIGFMFWLSLGLGALLVLLTFHASAARWAVGFRRILEILSLAVVPSAVLVLPILIGMNRLFPWAKPGFGPLSHEDLFAFKAAYLNKAFFVLRAALYFVTWSIVAWLLIRWSVRQDTTKDPSLPGSQRKLGTVALPLVGLTATFAEFDYVMSLDPRWGSEMFGLYQLAAAYLAALAVLAIVGRLAFQRDLLPTVTRELHFHSLGKLIFAAVCFWAYLAYAQYMLIWIANLPREITWFVRRTEGPWRSLFYTLIVFHFFVPFFALISRPAKLHLGFLSLVSGLILVAHFLEIYWIVLPNFPGVGPSWTDLTGFIGVGGIHVAFVLWRFKETTIAAIGAPEIAAATT